MHAPERRGEKGERKRFGLEISSPVLKGGRLLLHWQGGRERVRRFIKPRERGGPRLISRNQWSKCRVHVYPVHAESFHSPAANQRPPVTNPRVEVIWINPPPLLASNFSAPLVHEGYREGHPHSRVCACVCVCAWHWRIWKERITLVCREYNTSWMVCGTRVYPCYCIWEHEIVYIYV